MSNFIKKQLMSNSATLLFKTIVKECRRVLFFSSDEQNRNEAILQSRQSHDTQRRKQNLIQRNQIRSGLQLYDSYLRDDLIPWIQAVQTKEHHRSRFTWQTVWVNRVTYLELIYPYEKKKSMEVMYPLCLLYTRSFSLWMFSDSYILGLWHSILVKIRMCGNGNLTVFVVIFKCIETVIRDYTWQMS